MKFTKEEFNKKIKHLGWQVKGEYNGSNKECIFKCLKCENLKILTMAHTIYKHHKCLNCKPYICVNCNKEYLIKSPQAANRKFCYDCIIEHNRSNPLYSKIQRIKILNKIKQRYGIKCIKCGYDKNYSSLDFHHLNPNEKKINPAHIIHNRGNINKIFEELDKCILLCANCHREIHQNKRSKDLMNINNECCITKKSNNHTQVNLFCPYEKIKDDKYPLGYKINPIFTDINKLALSNNYKDCRKALNISIQEMITWFYTLDEENQQLVIEKTEIGEHK
jgi:hypothetical protein